MDHLRLIPTPDTLPAPWGVFEILGLLTLTIHFLLINSAVGGSLITLFSRLRGPDPPLDESLHGAVVNKIPSAFALGINMGVAPLLFVQVLYGHLIYSSSVLMAVFWIMVIPLLIIAYYAAYIHSRKYSSARLLSLASLAVSTCILLYIPFAFVNNMTMMLQPEVWTGYFANRGGLLLNLGDPMLWPRYFHFLVASVAVGGLFTSVVWAIRGRKNSGADRVKVCAHADEKVCCGLRIFAMATAVQMVVGFWLLLSLPPKFIMIFMGGNPLYTAVLFSGIVLGLASIITAVLARLVPTVILLVSTVTLMVVNRSFLRTTYLSGFFSVKKLELAPQYDVMLVFFAVLLVGLAAVGYMLKQAVAAERGREAP